jgi:hypothetical protein
MSDLHGTRPAAGAQARLPGLVSAAGGMAAAAVAWGVMRVLRTTLQVRTLPERVTEWLLLFVPLDLFEAGLRRFGYAAKQYALAGAVVVLLALLAWLGAVALRRRWSGSTLAALGLGLWLLTMVGVMPLTGAGLFATDLIRGTGAAVAGYLAIALAYVAALATVAALAEAAGGGLARRPASGPAALLLAGAAGAAFAGAPYVAAWSPHPALPAAVVPAPPVALPPDGAARADTGSAVPVPDARPTPAPGGEAPPALADQERPWNTTDLDAATNGNLGRAAEAVAAAGVPEPETVPLGGADAGRAPWRSIGEVHEFTGTVERTLEYAPGAPLPPWPTALRPLGEVVLSGSAESGLMPVVCVTVGSPGDLQEGERVRARGFVVGLADALNRTGGSTTGLVLVGEIARLPAPA